MCAPPLDLSEGALVHRPVHARTPRGLALARGALELGGCGADAVSAHGAALHQLLAVVDTRHAQAVLRRRTAVMEPLTWTPPTLNRHRSAIVEM